MINERSVLQEPRLNGIFHGQILCVANNAMSDQRMEFAEAKDSSEKPGTENTRNLYRLNAIIDELVEPETVRSEVNEFVRRQESMMRLKVINRVCHIVAHGITSLYLVFTSFIFDC